MPHKLSTLVSILALVGGVAGVPASAQSQSPLPQEQMQGSVAYLSGGIGLDESDAIKKAAPNYPLELEFVRTAVPRAEYLSDVKVTIKDHTGKTVLDTVAAGPFLLAKLPAGSFTVLAQHADVGKQRVVNIKARGHERVMFVWQ